MAKTYTIADDGTSAKEVLKVVVEEEVTETKRRYDGTLTDINTEIASQESARDFAIAKISEMEALKLEITAELDKEIAKRIPEVIK